MQTNHDPTRVQGKATPQSKVHATPAGSNRYSKPKVTASSKAHSHETQQSGMGTKLSKDGGRRAQGFGGRPKPIPNYDHLLVSGGIRPFGAQ